MNIQLLSDLHLEFHADHGHDFIKRLDPTGVDVLVLAGDISTVAWGRLSDALYRFCAKFPQVVFVAGNHEYYGSSVGGAIAAMKALAAATPNLHWLDNDAVILGGQRFVGSTLWFPNMPDGLNRLHASRISDFQAIEGLTPWVYTQNLVSAAYLADNVQTGDVVVTHHIPTIEGVHPKWLPYQAGLGRFFLSQLPYDVLGRASHWVYGHTHETMDFTIGSCRFRTNPLGYPRGPKDTFQDKLLL